MDLNVNPNDCTLWTLNITADLIKPMQMLKIVGVVDTAPIENWTWSRFYETTVDGCKLLIRRNAGDTLGRFLYDVLKKYTLRMPKRCPISTVRFLFFLSFSWLMILMIFFCRGNLKLAQS